MQQTSSDNIPRNSTNAISGVIFRRSIRSSYASLDLIQGDTHTRALVQFHIIKEVTAVRSYVRRSLKLGSEIELSGHWTDGRFQVELVEEQNGNYAGLHILQKQKLDMIACQRVREKYYPSFDQENKEKVKQDSKEKVKQDSKEKVKQKSHDAIENSMSKKKQKKTEGTGHGGGIGKRRQGEIVRDFLVRLVAKQLQEKESSQDIKNSGTEITIREGLSKADRTVDIDQSDAISETIMKIGTDFLNNGSGVMDVAGGSGHVSLALSLKGIKSTVIDPRETVGKLPARDRKVLKKAIKANMNALVPAGPQTLQGDSEKARFITIPPPIEFDALRAWFAKRPDGIDTEFREGSSNLEPLDSVKAPIPVCTLCSPDNLLSSCSAIVALHPDEATGDIVDFAVKHRLPFLVVPCCVFSRLFSFRFISSKDVNDPNDKKLVSTYDDLIEYLVAKHDSIRVSKLNFEGANIAIWSTFPNEERAS